MRFQGKSVLVLGGNSGIGLSSAKAFQAEGARVALTGRNQQTLDEVAGKTGMEVFRSDMGDVAGQREIITQISDMLGGLDILFVNAGVGGFANVPDITEQFWDGIHDVNVRGAFFAVQSALPHMRDGGSIVITGSIGSVMALPGNAAYAAAKAGLRAAARILATELLPRKIRVNMVSPGPVKTGLFQRDATKAETEAMHEMMANAVPMKRMGEASEIAAAVLFLASDEASFINGVDLFADGGCVEL